MPDQILPLIPDQGLYEEAREPRVRLEFAAQAGETDGDQRSPNRTRRVFRRVRRS